MKQFMYPSGVLTVFVILFVLPVVGGADNHTVGLFHAHRPSKSVAYKQRVYEARLEGTRESAAAREPEDFLIQRVRVFDGERTIHKTSVLIRNGVIEGFGPLRRTPKGIRVIDGRGLTLLPGLIDAHTHIRSRQDLEQSLMFGVTTDLSMLMDVRLAADEKAKQKTAQGRDSADLFSSGYCATAPGGHGTEYGFKFPTITGPKDAQTWVDDRIAEGSDFIKIMYERGGDNGHGGRPSIDKPTLEALVVAAHLRRKLAIVHIHSEQQAMEAIESGADGLAHLFSHGGDTVDPRFAPLVAAHHAFVIPTFTVLESVCNLSPGQRILDDPNLGPYLLQAYVPQLKKNIDHGQENHCMFSMSAIPSLLAAHVPILAGTDAGNPGTAPGASLHGELEYLVEAGLTPQQALVAATSAPAAAFHLSGRGRIAPGLRADLVLVNGDPTVNIKVTRNIVGIWKGGAAVDRQTWLERVKAASSQGATQRDGTSVLPIRPDSPRPTENQTKF